MLFHRALSSTPLMTVPTLLPQPRWIGVNGSAQRKVMNCNERFFRPACVCSVTVASASGLDVKTSGERTVASRAKLCQKTSPARTSDNVCCRTEVEDVWNLKIGRSSDLCAARRSSYGLLHRVFGPGSARPSDPCSRSDPKTQNSTAAAVGAMAALLPMTFFGKRPGNCVLPVFLPARSRRTMRNRFVADPRSLIAERC